jgi:hypothetical protein
MVPLDESFDDHSEHAEVVVDRRFLQRLSVAVLPADEEQFVVLDVTAVELPERDNGRVVIIQPATEKP